MNFILFTLFLILKKSCAISYIEELQNNVFNAIKNEKLKLFKTLNISKNCATQLDILTDGRHNDILLKMVDSSAKFPYSGILKAGRTELGNYDECISIDHTFEEVQILGKYCFAGFVWPDFSNSSNFDLYYKLSTCIPDACSAEDFLKFPRYFKEDFPSLVTDEFCITKESGKEFSIGNIITMSVFGFFVLTVILSTLYDVIRYKINQKKEVWPILVAFSAVSNTRNLLHVSLEPCTDIIDIFSGFRFITVVWIIAGQAPRFFYYFRISLVNEDKVANVFDKLYITTNLAVTTFFFMSGFLVSYVYFKRENVPWLVQVKAIPSLYFHRYIRLTIPIFFLYILVVWIFPKVGDGPVWQIGCESEIGNCRENWWSYFLYIQNYVNWGQLCLIPLWYLSADMQMFLLSPFILIFTSVTLTKQNGLNKALLFLGFLNIFFVVLNIGIRELFPTTRDNIYDTHGRLAEYFIGFMMGVFMRFKKEEPFLDKINNKTIINLSIWIATLVVMFTVFLFYGDAEQFEQLYKTLYLAIARSLIWTTGLCWMVYSCYHGYGGFITWFLSLPIFQIGAKLTYSMYLLHFPVIWHYGFSNRLKWYYSDYVEFYTFCGILIETCLWSYLWTLMFEIPFKIIEKYFFDPSGKYKVNKHEEENNV